MGQSLAADSLARFSRWRRRKRVQNIATLSIVVVGPILVGLTWWVMGPLDRGGSAPSLRAIILADLVYVMVIAGLVLQRIVRMLAARRARSAGSRLHSRLTGAFTLMALLPTVIVAVFAVLTINIGLEGWFSDRVRTVLSASQQAAQAYADEHRNELSRDAQTVASYLDSQRQSIFFMNDGDIRQALGRFQSQIERGLSEAFVIDSAGDIRARAPRSYDFGYEEPSAADFAAANASGLQIIEDPRNNEFRALLPLPSFTDRYLYVTRLVDGEILSLLDQTQATVALYEQLERDRGRVLFEFGLLYLGFAMILMLASVWLAFWFADRLSAPIGRLLVASQKVGAGDFDVRVVEDEGEDEISQLGKYFNAMTSEIKLQHEELVATSLKTEERRRLFDSVLTAVTSGVIGLSDTGGIDFSNPSAHVMLRETNLPEGCGLASVVPEFAPLFDSVRQEGRVVSDQINLTRGGKQKTLLVQMAPRQSPDGALVGYVVVFDDVTELVSAQRQAAWGDVARRIAHEIKNPLTPIQLSAERIKRKFGNRLGEDSAALAQMTDVIIRQTDDLRRIVDEFSRFARMPQPEKRVQNMLPILNDAVALQVVGQPDVAFDVQAPSGRLMASLDGTMISQALTNLLKNAGEALQGRREKYPDAAFVPRIKVQVEVIDDMMEISISDNGIGLPDDRVRLFEPYVTTRDKGTGLGLAIVKKIIEEHGGTLDLVDAQRFDEDAHVGAMAVFRLPLAAEPAAQPLIGMEA
ncbi:nitrogen regulation protein NtrY [Ketogulonicigenium robustum]|uniref:histidine kinase n=1 Tax=Ketogulonicigenium robustum TaxID=92947 RepID=A0A1W6NZG1_9RHOB|nr:PAS domain-containing sensor histidine kinase [Ketogulonicigenium robustum]ARO14646.1 nitrogen regulation protein NtrY [Ketogulonicigenium robustum]